MIKRVTHYVAVILAALLFSHSVMADNIALSQASELANRFRIDHMVSSVTLLVQREYGSAPVIVVQPDGSKWYANRHPDSVKWMDGLTGDMITIDNPTPGPWQLIGRITPGSVIHKVSTLSIDVDPIPQPLYQGERLKLTTRLLGDQKRVRLPGLDYLMNWTVKFVSNHDPSDENFAAGSFIVGSYRDNGEALDERPDDGIFTSKINLTEAWGGYTLKVIAKNAVLERQYSAPFRLSPRPIDVEIVAPTDVSTGQWALKINVDEEQLQLSHTHIEAEFVGPGGMMSVESITDINHVDTLHRLTPVSDFGSYRIKLNAVSTTRTGREIYLTLPELFFNFVRPPEPPPSAEALALIAKQQAKHAEKVAMKDALFWLVFGNVLLFGLGLAVLGFVYRRHQLKRRLLIQAQKEKARSQQKMVMELDEIDLMMPEDLEQKKDPSDR
ncbi:TIGR03503 family protein [Shewanella sp.]|nr:TIGR03503 family protein [Shewanella sp.]